jgi:hypothetical protein
MDADSPSKRTVRIPIGGGVVVQVVEGEDGLWRWHTWYRWETKSGIPNRAMINPPTQPYRLREFATKEDAAVLFRSLIRKGTIAQV